MHALSFESHSSLQNLRVHRRAALTHSWAEPGQKEAHSLLCLHVLRPQDALTCCRRKPAEPEAELCTLRGGGRS